MVEKENKVFVGFWRGGEGVCLPDPATDSMKQQHFGTNSAGKILDIIKPENNPKKPVINWDSLRENKAKYEAMKWAG